MKLTETEVSAILFATLKGLVYLHGQQIIHRDLKSANILLSTSGEAKIGMPRLCCVCVRACARPH